MLNAATLQQLAEDTLRYAKRLGASECALSLGCDQGVQAAVRLGQAEQCEFHNSNNASLVVYRGKSRASASTNQLDSTSLHEMAKRAFDAAGSSAADACAGLADTAELAREFHDFQLYHPRDLSPQQAVELAHLCEQEALAHDSRLVNSEGAECSASTAVDCLALSNGFNQVEHTSSFALGCALIGQGQGQQQVGYWYDYSYAFSKLDSPKQIGKKAAQKTLSKLDARSVVSGKYPVLFDQQMAQSLWRMLLSAISGSALYRKSTCLEGKLGERVFPKWLSIEELPHQPSFPGSSNYDDEGVATRAKHLVTSGVLSSYLFDSYSARKCNSTTTGNAGGITNLILHGETQDFSTLCRQLGTGLIVRETMGRGLNLITGDFSVGASGDWVENGTIVHPVQVVTISGNLFDMFRGIIGLGSDIDTRKAVRSGSVLLEQMHVGGSE